MRLSFDWADFFKEMINALETTAQFVTLQKCLLNKEYYAEAPRVVFRSSQTNGCDFFLNHANGTLK